MKTFVLVLLLGASLAAAAVVTYSYDTAGRLVKVDYGSDGSIVYTYDNAGNLTSRTTISAASVTASNAAKASVAPAAKETESKPKAKKQ